MTYDEVGKSPDAAVLRLSPDELPAYLAAQTFSPRPFTDFMRQTFREKKLSQKEIFIRADLDDRYGYKLISEQKHTTQRDTILRLCLAARFDLNETDEALILYGMAPLHARIPRDAAFIVAIQNRVYDIHDVDAILRENDLPPFLT
jgi:hypothetical protein